MSSSWWILVKAKTLDVSVRKFTKAKVKFMNIFAPRARFVVSRETVIH